MSDPISAAIGIVKQLIETAKTVKNAEIKMLTAELQLQLAEAKQAMAELMEQNLELRQQNAAILAVADEPQPELRGELYFKQDGAGPFCTTCYDRDRKFFRVTEMAQHFWAICRWRCNVCQSKFGGRR